MKKRNTPTNKKALELKMAKLRELTSRDLDVVDGGVGTGDPEKRCLNGSWP